MRDERERERELRLKLWLAAYIHTYFLLFSASYVCSLGDIDFRLVVLITQPPIALFAPSDRPDARRPPPPPTILSHDDTKQHSIPPVQRFNSDPRPSPDDRSCTTLPVVA